jgi:hypothetical protein
LAAKVSAHRRAKAARELRAGGSEPQAAAAAGVRVRTIARWKKEPDFLALLHSRGVLQAGPIKLVANDADALDDVETDESVVWIATGGNPEVLGSLVVSEATHCRAVFVAPNDVPAVRADLASHCYPLLPEAKTAVLVQSALQALTDPEELALLTTICTAPEREAFRAFLGVWRYRSQERKEVRVLGEDVWPAQEQLVDAIIDSPALMILKARKLGLSTVCIAYCGFVLRFRDRNARVHLFSRTERSALDLFAAVKFGLDNLPAHLRLPKVRETLKQLDLEAGLDDRRELVSYPTSDATAVEAQASHSMVDEAADIPRWNVVFSGLEPTMTGPGATSHIIFTGAGPANPTSEHFKRAQAGDTIHKALFIDALQRPDRDEEWLQRKRSQMLASQFKCEYPMSAEEALAGSSDFVFAAEDVDEAHCSRLPKGRYYCSRHSIRWRTDNLSARCPKSGCRTRGQDANFVIGWDIGGSSRNADASVGSVLDVSGGVVFVVEQRRFQGIPYAPLGLEIERLARDYPRAPVAIEMSGIGAAVRGNLSLPDQRIVEFWTTVRSKARIIGNVAVALQNQELKYDQRQCPNLRTELLGYMSDDEFCVTDCVMSLAIALDQAGSIPPLARVMCVLQV